MPQRFPEDRATRLLGLAQRTGLLEGLEPLDQQAIMNTLTYDQVRKLVERDPLYSPMGADVWDQVATKLWTEDSAPSSTGRMARTAAGLGLDIGYPALGAVGGGILGIPGGPGGIAIGAGIGAAGMESLHQLLKQGQVMLGGEPLGEPPPETSREAAGRIGMAGALGPLQEAAGIRQAAGAASVVGPALRKGAEYLKLVKPKIPGIPELAAEFKVPVTPGEQTQGIAIASIEALLKRSMGGSGVYHEYYRDIVNPALVKAGRQIADDISGMKMSPREAGVYVQKALKTFRETTGNAYGAVLEDISTQAGSRVQLDMTGPLQQSAKELLGQWSIPGPVGERVRDVEAVGKAMRILEAIADPTVTRQIPASAILDPEGLPTRAARTVKEIVPLTFDDARKLRTLLFKITESGEMSIGKGLLGQLNHSLDEAMGAALRKAGRGDLVTKFHLATKRFHYSRNLLEQSTMESVAKTDKFETILDMLTFEKGSESAMRTLRHIIREPEKRQAIKRAIWEQIFEAPHKGAVVEGVLIGDRLERILDNIGGPALKAIFGPNELSEIRRFTKLADTISLKSTLTRPITAAGPTLMALGQSSAAIGGFYQASKGETAGEKAGGWLLAGFGLLSPYMMSRMLTRPGATQIMTKALTTPAETPAGRAIAARLAAWAVQYQQRQSREDQRELERRATELPPIPIP